MAGSSGRKPGVNVSQYIADLNKVPSDFDLDRSAEDAFSLDEELAQFTNAEFLDFDSGNFLDGSATTGIDYSENADVDTTKNEQVKAGKQPTMSFAPRIASSAGFPHKQDFASSPIPLLANSHN